MSNEHPLHFQGLNDYQVSESRRRHGENVLTPPEQEPWWKLYLEKFADPIIRILLVAAVVAIGVGMIDGHYVEGLGILLAIFLATTMAFWNEYRAAKEFDVLNQVTDDTPVKAIRGGQFVTIPKREVVVGDILLMELGEEMPADGILIEGVSFQVDESKLTGESVPAAKYARGTEIPEAEAQHQAAYPHDVVLRGTMIVDGHGTVEVSAVGDGTDIGRTARQAAEKSEEKTPLSIQLERLSKIIGVIGFAIAGLLFFSLVLRGYLNGELSGEKGLSGQQWFLFGLVVIAAVIGMIKVWLPIFYDGLEIFGVARKPDWLRREGSFEWLKFIGGAFVFFLLAVFICMPLGLIPTMDRWVTPETKDELQALVSFFMIAVTVIVVAVPEGLPMSVTLSLAYSMRKMTASNNLVRRMHACETIGAATVICTDKTGTLTMNEMTVGDVAIPVLESGAEVRLGKASISAELLVDEAMAVNSTANLAEEDGKVRAIGNPTEGALLLWLRGRGVDYLDVREKFPVEKQWTFSTERKFMGTLGRSDAGISHVLHAKGAPEILLQRCSSRILADGSLAPVDAGDVDRLIEELKVYQGRGMRSLGFAVRLLDDSAAEEDDILEVAEELVWIGFVAIADPVRPDVPAAIQNCRDAGIDVKIVTGDNHETAQEIGRQIHLILPEDEAAVKDGRPEYILTGAEFEAMSDAQAERAVGPLKVMSRARPHHKLRLVKTLQKQGEVVAVTGDGTNDAPALNHANVGLAMGIQGTAVAKEAADIILLDDSFTSIVNAVQWGRSLYQNIQRFILFQLTINVTALCIAMLGPFLGIELPLTVTQMLWVNLIMDTLAALALATEPPHREVMRRPPRDPKAFIITREMGITILCLGGVFLVFLLSFLFWLRGTFPALPGSAEEKLGVSRYGLTIFFNTFVMLQFWNLFNARCLGLRQSAFKGLWENKAFVFIAAGILLGQFLFVQFGGDMFRTTPLGVKEWLAIIAGTSVVLWGGEIIRFLQRRLTKETLAA